MREKIKRITSNLIKSLSWFARTVISGRVPFWMAGLLGKMLPEPEKLGLTKEQYDQLITQSEVLLVFIVIMITLVMDFWRAKLKFSIKCIITTGAGIAVFALGLIFIGHDHDLIIQFLLYYCPIFCIIGKTYFFMIE